MKLKVTFLTGEYPPMQGGIADHTAYLSKHLSPLEITPSILISRRWSESEPHIEVQLDDQALHSFSQPVYASLPGWGWRCWPRISNFIQIHRPDILHIQYQAAAFDLGGWVNWLPWYLKKRGANTRLVTTFHDLRIPYIFPKAGPLRWKSIVGLARFSDGVICTNREDLNTLQHQLPAAEFTSDLSTKPASHPERQGPSLALIPLGSNVEPQPPANFNRADWRLKYRAQPNTLLLAYFGFLNESKGGEELIEALALLRQQQIDARLLFIGGDIGHADPTNVAYAQRVQTLIDRLELAEFVHRTGYVDPPDVSANLMAADAVVMPYRDGVSFRRTTLIAALRHGCPIVSTIPADPDLIPEIMPGQNMLLAAPENASALAQTIAPLAKHPDLGQKLALGARQLGNRFEWEKIAGKTAALYRALL